MTGVAAERVAIVGDLGGHSAELRRTLESLGVEFDADAVVGDAWRDVGFAWPPGLHVVQVGDLVHRGPDSLGVVLLVDRLLEQGVWSQVVGNHEQQYVSRPAFVWDEEIPQEAIALLRGWWADGRMVPGVAVEASDGEQWLITHGGLTLGFWEFGLGKPPSAQAALTGLAEAAADGALWFPGQMLTGETNRNAGPVWAEAGFEVYPSWLEHPEPMPFHQAHGHSSAYWWDVAEWRCDRRVRHHLTLDETLRHETFILAGRRIVGVDPAHGVVPSPHHGPLMLGAATVLGA